MMGFLLFQPNPVSIGMIGLGGGSLAKYCYSKLPEADFTAIELSPDVIALREDFGVPADSPRFRVVCADGADYIRRNADSFDVLLVDGFDRNGQPEQLCSLEFYDNCRTALRPGGILVINLCADDRACPSYVSRVHTAFSGKVLAIDADEGENRIVFAGKEGLFPPSFSILTERLRTLESAHPVDLDLTAQKLLRQGRHHTKKRR
jgi:spermidine synthase